MQIKKLPKSQIEFKVSIPWKKWGKYIDSAVKNISNDIKVEGFRPGKAPRDIIEKKVGKETILNEASQKAIEKSYPEIVNKEKIEAIGSPQVEILTLAENNDLEYKIITAVMPKITLGKWQDDIKKTNKKYSAEKIEVSSDDIQKDIEKLANSRAKLITVNRPAKKGDSVQLDFVVKQSGVPIENGTSKNHTLVLGKNVFIPGFEEKIIGMKAGEEKEFELTFPKEYHAKNLAGKPAQFEVKIDLIQKVEVPEINDEFAQSLGQFKTLKDLEKNIADGFKREKEIKQKETKRIALIESLVKNIEVELPDILLDEEIHKMFHEFEAQIQQAGMNMEQYLERLKKKREDIEKEWRPQAEKRVKSALALETLIKEREIEISSEKIEEEMNKTIQHYGGAKEIKDKLDMARLYNHTKNMLQNEEMFEILEKM